MPSALLPILATIAAPLGILGWGLAAYNNLIARHVETQNSWSQIDVQLKRRYDLIPSLVETVKGYAALERDTLERVTKARNMAVKARGVAEQARAENLLTAALKGLFAVAEPYPDLKRIRAFCSSRRS
jgi:LemA protein